MVSFKGRHRVKKHFIHTMMNRLRTLGEYFVGPIPI